MSTLGLGQGLDEDSLVSETNEAHVNVTCDVVDYQRGQRVHASLESSKGSKLFGHQRVVAPLGHGKSLSRVILPRRKCALMD